MDAPFGAAAATAESAIPATDAAADRSDTRYALFAGTYSLNVCSR
ncbi:MAG TPA: hypothetical protein VMM78_09960 [Thermomicrobiales bacterium]|nr:hypothetical protein [Thermomicrobiales bacterium]